MAARLNKAHQEDIRLKIKTSQLINRLQGFALGDGVDPKTKEPIDLDNNRLRAIEILLKKALPDLSNVQITGDANNPVAITTIERRIVKAGD
jgi:hypothetical protein